MHGMMSAAYKDGSYVGNAADAFYGYIQVKAVIQNGAITDVQFLQHPNDHSTSIEINNQAMPYLKQEAIKAQSSQVDIVSGATDTSYAFIESLKTALNKART
ncbi:FMN-binding protein [Candidatus Saccharibacteria bacterium]|nr:FMN-binding protein [Candidatus Saccharibacteria bacterium]